VVVDVEEDSTICVERLERCLRECQKRMSVECTGPAGCIVVAGRQFADERGRKLAEAAEGG